MKSEHVQTPVLNIGSHIELGDCIGKVVKIFSRESVDGKRIPYVNVQHPDGGVIGVPGNIIEEALQLK